MYCPYCAEEIQDAAILCRHCGARKVEGAWTEPAPATPRASAPGPATPEAPAGQFTMHTAAICFLLSAVFELYSIREAVPMVGELRGGAVAIAYHLTYAVLFVAVGMGLWGGWRWGYWVVLGATLLYTIDKGIYLLDTQVLELQAQQMVSRSMGFITRAMVPTMVQSIRSLTFGVVVCWWGFAFYVYLRRAYFTQRDPAAS